MKLLGVIAILGSCLGVGLGRSEEFRKELDCLGQLVSGVRTIRSELLGRLSPVKELTALAARASEGAVSEFFTAVSEKIDTLDRQSFSEVWSKEAERLAFLSAEERGELLEFGASVGRYGLEDRVLACDRYLSVTERRIEELSRAYPERRKLTLSMSAAAGAFLCLLLI